MRGFTLVELLVSIGIFVLMTTLLVVKYGSFNQGILLTDLAYDVAIALRTAQTYGIGVINTGSGGAASFSQLYGVHFSSLAGENDRLKLFSSPTYLYTDPGKIDQGTQVMVRGSTILSLCVGNGTVGVCGASGTTQSTADKVDIVFKRPDPAAIICATISGVNKCGSALTVSGSAVTYAAITIGPQGASATDKRWVIVSTNGQIYIPQ